MCNEGVTIICSFVLCFALFLEVSDLVNEEKSWKINPFGEKIIKSMRYII